MICRCRCRLPYETVQRIYFILYVQSYIYLFYGMTSKTKALPATRKIFFLDGDYKVSVCTKSIQFSSSSYKCTCNRVKRKLPHTRQNWITAHITIMDNFMYFFLPSSHLRRPRGCLLYPIWLSLFFYLPFWYVIFSHIASILRHYLPIAFRWKQK